MNFTTSEAADVADYGNRLYKECYQKWGEPWAFAWHKFSSKVMAAATARGLAFDDARSVLAMQELEAIFEEVNRGAIDSLIRRHLDVLERAAAKGGVR